MKVTPQNTFRTAGIWQAAQAASVMGAISVAGLLILQPEWGLYVTWYVLVPLVPALLLLAPRLWRNLCPISVVHQLPRVANRSGRRRLKASTQRWTPAIAMTGLFLIVPLRHPIFNVSGPALAALLVGVLVVALLGGLLFAGKAGWCSSFCPVVPVERLYGQQPLMSPRHAHCAECVGCSAPCFDRHGARAVARMAGAEAGVDGRETPLWRTPTSAFAAGFPGFVLGYFTVEPASPIPVLYFHVALFTAGALLLFAVGQEVFRFRTLSGVRWGAAIAAALYYWFTVPAVIAQTEFMWGIVSFPGWLTIAARAVFLGLVILWLVDAPRRERAGASTGGGGALTKGVSPSSVRSPAKDPRRT